MTQGLTARDDSYHEPVSKDPWWTETAWFSVDVPERDLSVIVYPIFRANLNVCSLAVIAWDATGHEPHRARYWKHQWHLPMPQSDLAHLRLDALSYDVIDPLTSYHVVYDDGPKLSLDLTYTGLVPPQPAGGIDWTGHIDQPCHVAGTIVLQGTEIPVDGFAMRDRSWTVRRDDASWCAGYAYGLSAEHCFLFIGEGGGDVYDLRAGWLWRDGTLSRLKAGKRQVVTRASGGWPTAVHVGATDEIGRTIDAVGTCSNRLEFPANPALFSWISLTRWNVDGTTLTGEDQDIASVDQMYAAWESQPGQRSGR